MRPVTLRTLLFLLSVLAIPMPARAIDAPTGLLCELMRWPEKAVITDATPEFGWIFPPGHKQQAYRILVASNSELLEEGRADQWDSGKVESTASIDVSYGGTALKPDRRYWWKVKVWADNGEISTYSLPQQFNTGTFDRDTKDWPGKSDYVQLPDKTWVCEDRQIADFERKDPVIFKEASPNRWFADFGKSAFATLELEVSSSDDAGKLEIFLGERKNDDLTVHKQPGHSYIGFEKLEITLKKGTHTYQVEIPKHHSKSPHSQQLAPIYPEVLPFRYVEVNGRNGMTVKKLTQLALYYPFDEAASSFKSSSDALNQVWELCRYTLKATPFLGLYADGNRERMPYEADAYIQQLGHTRVDREYAIARYTTDFLIFHSSWPTEWQLHTVLMAWEDYMQTGNRELLEKRYDQIRVKTLIALTEDNDLISSRKGKVSKEFLQSLHYDGRSFRDIVDWPMGTPQGKKPKSNAGPTPEGERDGYVFTDFNTVVNALHYRAIVLMARIAAVVEKPEDVTFFEKRAEKVKAAMQSNLIDPKRGIFVDGIGTDHASLHANMFPLAFDLVPEKHLNTVLNHIQSRGMACSVYGAQHLLDGLYSAGASDYAMSLMTSDDQRSWLNMIRVGSTMTTEAWDEYYKPNLTWNHAWGSAPANIIPRWVMGIQPLEPGFGKIRIMPQPGSLKEAELTMPTIRGSVHMKMVNRSGHWQIGLTIPGNVETELWLPTSFTKVTVNGEAAQSLKEARTAAGEWKVYLLSPGTHAIVAN